MADEAEDSVLGQLLADEASTSETTKPEMAELQRQLDYERQRNDSLQGRVDSQLRPLNQTIRELKQQLSAGQATPVYAPEAEPATVQDLLAELTPEEREAVGEKQLAIMARLIERPTQAMVARVREELQQSFDGRMRQVEGQIAGQTGKDLWERVEQLSPGVLARNSSDDPRWVEFLNGTDAISGRSRKVLGNAAVDSGDVSRLALLHDEFLRESGQATPEDTPRARRDTRPEGSRAEAAVGSGGKPNIKGAEVEQFYKDLASGKYEGKPELAEKMETLITAAVQDGRVI